MVSIYLNKRRLYSAIQSQIHHTESTLLDLILSGAPSAIVQLLSIDYTALDDKVVKVFSQPWIKKYKVDTNSLVCEISGNHSQE